MEMKLSVKFHIFDLDQILYWFSSSSSVFLFPKKVFRGISLIILFSSL
jgi:hypothetical protein